MKYCMVLVYLCSVLPAVAQSAFTEGSVIYDIHVESAGTANAQQTMNGAVQTLHVKGFQVRLDFESAVGFSTVIMDQRQGKYALMRGSGDSKFLTQMDESQWIVFNKKYAGLLWQQSGKDSLIQGYKVAQATTTLKDGGKVVVWYTEDLKPLAKQYDMMMVDIPGLPLNYTMTYPEMTLMYKVRQISFAPVMNTRFAIPQSGYKVLEPKKQ